MKNFSDWCLTDMLASYRFLERFPVDHSKEWVLKRRSSVFTERLVFVSEGL